MNGRYVVDENGKRVAVLLEIEEYERMIEEIEELEDILAYKEAKAALENGGDESIPLEQAMREIREGKVKGDQ
jgi:PHD/YefM family antitoxin component YafN of YafNO toxin-antitoxin module